MKRLERLEKAGYKVSTVVNTGNVVVSRRDIFTKSYTSITHAHKMIFGY
jgi:biotin operon repressor